MKHLKCYLQCSYVVIKCSFLANDFVSFWLHWNKLGSLTDTDTHIHMDIQTDRQTDGRTDKPLGAADLPSAPLVIP